MKLMDLGKLLMLVSVSTLISCASETLIEDRYSLDYLDVKTGKPLVYPAGMDVPDQSTEYSIPKASQNAVTQKYDVNQIVKPPRIVPLPKEDEDEDDVPHFNIIFGIDPFVGPLGFEYQNSHHALGFGVIGQLSYRYYFNPYQDSKYWGVYLGKYNIDDNDEVVDGILFRDYQTQYIGFGIGKIWQWPSGWNVNASFTIQYYEDEYTNPGSSLKSTESGFFVLPGISAGFKF